MKNIFYISVLAILFNNIITAQPVKGSIEVFEGWNIIGALSTGPVSGTNPIITTVPPGLITGSIFEFENGYNAVNTLERGKGYWVNVTADGVLNFLSPCGGDIGRIYNTIQIGDQCWLRDNLDVGDMILGIDPVNNDGIIEKYCYDDNPTNCSNYGGLYQWDEAMDWSTTPGSQGICPEGWHIPTLADFTLLATNVSSNSNALKEIGQGSGIGVGTNESGFTALLAGVHNYTGNFFGLHYGALFWSSTESSGTNANILHLLYNGTGIDLSDRFKTYGHSVRCIQN